MNNIVDHIPHVVLEEDKYERYFWLTRNVYTLVWLLSGGCLVSLKI